MLIDSPQTARNPSRATSRAVEATLMSGARQYRRSTMLHRLLPGLMLSEDADAAQTSARIIAAPREALRHERARAGHWTYDLNRHLGLAQALRAELARHH